MQHTTLRKLSGTPVSFQKLKEHALRPLQLLLLTMFIVGGCKASQDQGSSIKSVDDGGCYQYQRQLDTLMKELQKMERVSTERETYWIDPSDSSQTSEPTSYTVYTDMAGSTKLKDLNRKIEKVRLDLSICRQNKIGVIDKNKLPGSGDAGHCDYNGQQYDILNYNCHSAANQSVDYNPFTTGIVSCGGLAPVYGSPAHHTFNYRVEQNTIVYYNWGQVCRAPRKNLPPDISDPDHRVCARMFCGTQYNDSGTLALPTGMKVEQPGPFYCSSNSNSRTSCNSCCQFRGKYWDSDMSDLRPTDSTFVDFMSQCYSACTKKFAR
jgi:hypothetical protein